MSEKPIRPIPKWAAALGHVPAFDDEPEWAFAARDPVTGVCYGYDIEDAHWEFGSGTGHTFAGAALDHLHNGSGSEEHWRLAVTILYRLGDWRGMGRQLEEFGGYLRRRAEPTETP